MITRETTLRIDQNEELMIIANYVNTVLWLTDDVYEELYNRSELFTQTNQKWENLLHDDSSIATVYANFYLNGNIEVYFQLWIGDCYFIDDNVPITMKEKQILWQEFKLAAKYQKTSVKELFEELREYLEVV